MASLIVISPGDSFHEIWPALASEAGFELRLIARLDDLPLATASSDVLVMVHAGSEETADVAIHEVRGRGYPKPFVVGARPEHRLAVRLVQEGAGDYFALPGDIEHLRGSLVEVSRRLQLRESRQLRADAERGTFDFGRIIGNSPALREALDRAARIIPHRSANVLLTGETGTGKELVAEAIHHNGPRASSPFVELNCAAIPANLLESELFGYVRGAFTDARSSKPGLFEAANRGTLFLDEIGHLPFELQGKILKALEDRSIRRLGAVETIPIDLRIIAATHVDLEEAVRQGHFREDLYYRISTIPIHLPPLRQRGDDVALLARHFVRILSEQYDLTPAVISAELETRLMTHTWPGNVRELRNAIERALLLSNGPLDPRYLFPQTLQAPADGNGALPFPASMAAIERVAAQAMLDRLQGNKSAAADALGISRSRLYRLLEETAVVP